MPDVVNSTRYYIEIKHVGPSGHRWQFIREHHNNDGNVERECLFQSVQFFDSEDEAERDALIKLRPLGRESGRPIVEALGAMCGEGFTL